MMLDIALLHPEGSCKLIKVMLYTRSSTPNFSTPLSREELKVFTSIRGETSLDAVVVTTKLDLELVKATIANLIARGLLVQMGSEMGGEVSLQTEAASSPKAVRWLDQRRAVEDYLLASVGGSRAQTYVAQLQDCPDEQTFVESTQSVAKRLSLIVDVGVGEQLLRILES